MRHSTRIALGYLGLSVLWIVVSDPMAKKLFPDEFTTISIYKGWAFVAITALLLKFWLQAEETRRDVVEARLQELAVTDGLTGILNRGAFMRHLETAVYRAERQDQNFGVIFLDVDNFKGVNDSRGHAVGDELLREVAQRITHTVRGSDIAARLGGDEFVVLVDDVDGLTGLAERLMAAFRVPFDLQGGRVETTVSIGLSRYPDDGMDADALMNSADAAMYLAKSEGRNRVVDASVLD